MKRDTVRASTRSPRLGRRTFLRGALAGASVAVGIPILDAMLNDHGTAFAGGDPLPRRFGVFYWGGGVVHETWVPSTTGMTWDLPDALSPFEGMQDYLTVVTGMNHANSSPGHIPARGIALSSSHDMDTSIEGVGTYRGQNHPEPSLDALVVESWTGTTTFDSVEVGICKKGPYQGNSSWKRGGSAYNRHELDPQKVYDRLFGMGIPTEDTHLFDITMKLEQSLLDAVKADGEALSNRLGKADKLRLEQHLDGIRALEIRLQNIANGKATSCADPSAPVMKDFGDGGSTEQKEDKSKIMSDLLTVALACNLTRVFSYEWAATQSEAVYWEVGVDKEHHQLTHDDPTGDGQRKIVKFIMQNFAYLADRLRQTPEGDHNLLDTVLILGTSEHAVAGYHDYNDHPLLLVGKAGGGIKSGQHYRASDSNNLDAPKVLLTAVRSVGLTIDQLGQSGSDAPRVATDSIGALEA